MANRTCTQRLKIQHLRVLRLAADGQVLVGDDARYESPAPATFNYTPTSPDRERIEQLDGNGDQCALYIGPPKAVDSVEITLTVCNQDAELTEMLAGGAIIDTATGGGDTIGYLSSTDATINVEGTAIEVWSFQWNGRERALRNGSPAFYRHTFTKTNWSLDEQPGAADAFSTVTYTGIAETNSGYGTGYDDDPFPVDMGESVYGWFIDTAMPAAACGYQAVAA